MASWGELLGELTNLKSDEEKTKWLQQKPKSILREISTKCEGRNVLFYSSAFLQKPNVHPGAIQITPEDINGFMSTMYGMDWSKGLVLILHTPGGVTSATETIVEYLHAKFSDIHVVVPTYAMSAGTMISLSANKVIMGRQSQLGPIDPQLPVGGGYVSARAIVDQFKKAKNEISKDLKMAHAWAPILQTFGPALLVEAENALAYGERMVSEWLKRRMFHGKRNVLKMAKTTAHYFNDATVHKSHGRRIGRDEARKKGVIIDDLENDQELQDLVLTVYHLMTIAFEHTPATKSIWTDHGQLWIKNHQVRPQ